MALMVACLSWGGSILPTTMYSMLPHRTYGVGAMGVHAGVNVRVHACMRACVHMHVCVHALVGVFVGGWVGMDAARAARLLQGGQRQWRQEQASNG